MVKVSTEGLQNISVVKIYQIQLTRAANLYPNKLDFCSSVSQSRAGSVLYLRSLRVTLALQSSFPSQCPPRNAMSRTTLSVNWQGRRRMTVMVGWLYYTTDIYFLHLFQMCFLTSTEGAWVKAVS